MRLGGTLQGPLKSQLSVLAAAPIRSPVRGGGWGVGVGGWGVGGAAWRLPAAFFLVEFDVSSLQTVPELGSYTTRSSLVLAFGS